MKTFEQLKKLGYNHYIDLSIKELDNLPNDYIEKRIEYSLVIDWFRKKHKLNAYVEYCNWNGVDEAWWEYVINLMDEESENISSEKYFNYQECLGDLILKLIEIVKEKLEEK